MTTYKSMSLEHLGDNATEEDLRLFRLACESRQRQTNESDDAVTDHCWNNGDWGRAVEQYAPALPPISTAKSPES